MKKYNKGFTMVELLAVIVILGILGTIGIVVTNKYLLQSRIKSYKIMSQSIYESTMNCMIQGNCATPTVTITSMEYTTAQLIELGYLKKLKNPISSREDCYGKVIVSINGTNATDYKKYKYDVSLKCDGVANTVLSWPESKTANEVEITRKIKESANNKENPLAVNGSNNSDSNSNNDKSNKNIVSAYTYNSTTCVTGEESTCVKTECYKNNTANSCKAGDIIDYKVNDTITVRFHVMFDNGTTMTMQSQKNTISSTPWYEGNEFVGPLTILPKLENTTSTWTNVNNQTYTMGTTVFKTNAYTGCTGLNKCVNNPYTMEERTAKARMITYQEALSLGCKHVESHSCPNWMNNFLYNSTYHGGTDNDNSSDPSTGSYNYGYWTMSICDSCSRPVGYRIDYYGYIGQLSAYLTGYGARAVVVINK